MGCEVTIKINNGVQSLTQKTMVYDDINAAYDDSKIDELIAEATKKFGAEVKKLTVNIKLLDQ